MNWIQNRSVKAKLMFCIIVLCGTYLVLYGTALVKMNDISVRSEKLYEQDFYPSLMLIGIDQSLFKIHSEYLHGMYTSNEEKEESIALMIQNQKSLLEEYREKLITEELITQYEELQRDLNVYNNKVLESLALLNEGEEQLAIDNMEEVIYLAEKAETLLNDFLEHNFTSAQEKVEGNGRGVRSETIFLLTLLSIVTIAGILFTLKVIKAITTKINELMHAAQQIANGNLDVNINIQSKDELGILADSFKEMHRNLREVVINIRGAAEQVAMGSKQVEGTSTYLAQGATEQANTIEELTVASEQLAAQINQNASHAEMVNDLASKANENVISRNAEMNEMLAAMAEINEASNDISKVIKVIDDIAFQTNILALNAAVEAARAGQHGKGFAVVAEEVRNLAARSAEAAKETTTMIEDSIKKVQDGTKLVNHAVDGLGKIEGDIKEVSELIHGIAVSCGEQAASINQINQGTMQISEVIQSNSATSQEVAAASQELASQAELMRGQVSKFKVSQYYQLDK